MDHAYTAPGGSFNNLHAVANDGQRAKGALGLTTSIQKNRNQTDIKSSFVTQMSSSENKQTRFHI